MIDCLTDILFIVPSYFPNIANESIGTLILAKVAKDSGYRVEIVRYWECYSLGMTYTVFLPSLLHKILEKRPKIVSFYCRSFEYHVSLDIADHIKKADPGITIIFGGPQADIVSNETIRAFPQVDYVCCGEGENTIVPVIDAIINGPMSALSNIPGLVFRSNGTVVKNKLPDLLPDNFVRLFNYYDLVPEEIISSDMQVGIDIGRGCPYSCYFCCTKNFWQQKYRLRDVSNILDEISFVSSKYNIQSFSFEHDLFTANKKRVLDFCDQLNKRELHINWNCSSRINTIDHEMIDAMADSGMSSIYFGVETGSNRMQDIIDKHINISKAIDVISYAQKKGVTVTISFIYGYPEETESDIEDTLQLIRIIREIGVTKIQLHRLSFDYGTKVYELYKDMLQPPVDDKFVNNYIGFSSLRKQYIDKYPTIFSSFYDYPSALRSSLEYLPLFLMLDINFPKTTSCLYAILAKYKKTILYAYEYFRDTCSGLLNSISNDTARISSPILAVMIDKLISGLCQFEILGDESFDVRDKRLLSVTFKDECVAKTRRS